MSDLRIHADHLPAIAVNAASNLKDACRFDFGSLSPENTQIVRQCGERIHIEKKKTADSGIAIGRELIVVKKTLPHGAFQAWVGSECGFSQRSAQIYMRVARLADKNANVALLPLNTAYRMGGRRISRWMLNAAAERVADGEEMTEAAVERLYKIFTRRARGKSRGLQSPRADVATEISRTAFKEPSSAELAEERAQWILKRCGEQFANSLVAMQDCGGLDAALRVLKTKLFALNLPVRRGSNGRS